MKYKALVSHSHTYGKILAEYEKVQRPLVRPARNRKLTQGEIIRRTNELDEVRKQLSQHEWEAPRWTEIEAAVPTGQPTEVRLRELDKIRVSLAQHIAEVRSAPSVSDKNHVDIDRIDIYLDGLQSLLSCIDIERRELAEEREPLHTQPGVTIVKEVTALPAAETELDMDELTTKKILTFSEAAAFLGITEHTLENKISEGSIPETCIDPASPTGRKRRFFREKLGQIQKAKKKQAAGEYEKIRWLSTPEVFEKLLSLLVEHDYLEPIALPKRHYTDKVSPVPTKHPLDWRFKGEKETAFAHLASLVYILHRKGGIEVSGSPRALRIPKYITSHFMLNGEPIKPRTVDMGLAKIHAKNGPYYPLDEISKITSKAFGTS